MIAEMDAAAFGACVLAAGALLAHLGARCHDIRLHLLHGTPALALALGVLSAMLAMHMGVWLYAPMLLALSVCAASDLACGYVFDRSLLFLFVTGMLPLLSGSRTYQQALVGAICGAFMLGLPYVLSRGRAMGFADVKVAAVIGTSLGAVGILESLAGAFVFGGSVGVLLLLNRRATFGHALAFVPFLGLGTMVVVLKGVP